MVYSFSEVSPGRAVLITDSIDNSELGVLYYSTSGDNQHLFDYYINSGDEFLLDKRIVFVDGQEIELPHIENLNVTSNRMPHRKRIRLKFRSDESRYRFRSLSVEKTSALNLQGLEGKV